MRPHFLPGVSVPGLFYIMKKRRASHPQRDRKPGGTTLYCALAPLFYALNAGLRHASLSGSAYAPPGSRTETPRQVPDPPHKNLSAAPSGVPRSLSACFQACTDPLHSYPLGKIIEHGTCVCQGRNFILDTAVSNFSITSKIQSARGHFCAKKCEIYQSI